MHDLPLVSVIMPIRDEGSHIERTLSAVLDQDYPHERLEVIVAEGLSRDDTRERVLAMSRRDPRVRLVDNPHGIVSTGFNRALAEARGSVIVRMDGHTQTPRDYVRHCVLELERTGADNVGGRWTSVGEGPFGRAVALAMSSPFGVGDALFRWSSREGWVDTVPFGAWRRELFERVGPFDEELVRNQDDEHNCRIRERGGRVYLSARLSSRYTVRGTPRALWKQYFEYGLWKVRVLQLHPRQMRPRQFAPPLLVAALGAVAVLSLVWPGGPWPLIVVGGVYAATCLGASLVAVVRHGSPLELIPRVAAAFAILHLAYGTGFLAGLVRFCHRWRVRADRPDTAQPATT